MIVCHCAGVTDASIRQLIRSGAGSVPEIVCRSGAGQHCEPCREEIAALLSEQQSALIAAAD